MSPSESELRAVLHEGEGSVPDADVVIARAMRVRLARRRMITSVASAAAVVAVVAVGGTLLVRAGSREDAGSAGGAANASAFQATHGGNPQHPVNGRPATQPATARANARATKGIACPDRYPRPALPGGGGTNQFGAGEPLFNAPVAAMRICVYGPTSALVEQTVLSSSTAGKVAAQLEIVDATNRPNCPTTTDEGDLAVYAVTSAGKPLPVVTVQLSCPWQATNGTAVRYLSPTIVDAIRPQLAPAPNNGSPIK